MRKTCLYILLGLLYFQTGFAQKIKTDVLVLGNSPGAVAAGIQSARSGVKTLLITEDEKPFFSLPADQSELINPKLTQSGVWAEFAGKYVGLKEPSGALPEKLVLKNDSANKVLQAISDTVKRLSILKNSSISEIKKSGKGWQLRLKNGQKINTLILVDGSTDHRLLKKLQVKLPDSLSTKMDGNNSLLRTSMAALSVSDILPIQLLIPAKTENIIAVPFFESPVSAMQAGQAAGATAAYCAFFKTNTQNLNIRLIQSELLTYKASLIPLGDILPSDSNFVKIQHVALSGIMNAGMKEQDGIAYFMPEGTVSTEEIKLPMKTFFSRSQIWLADHPSRQLTLDETVKFFMYTATRGEDLRREIEKGWKTSLGFTSNYDAQRPISRLEFAILMDIYLQPFNAKVDLQGQLIN